MSNNITEKVIDIFKNNIVGQKQAKEKILKTVKRIKYGLTLKDNKPIATTFLCGPTGVGKTYIVQCLALAMHDNKNFYLKIDCGSIQADHEIARLIGAPPGYIGHRETQPLITKEKINSNRSEYCNVSIILFDEFEKATPRLQDLLLSVMDTGSLQLGDGTTVHFDDVWIFLTSNLGSVEATRKKIGFTQTDSYNHYFAALKKWAKPEFIGRLTDIIVFDPLTTKNFYDIIELFVKKLNNKWNMSIKITEEAKKQILIQSKKTIALYGARKLEQYILELLGDLIADYFERLDRNFENRNFVRNRSVVIDWRDDKFFIQSKRSFDEMYTSA